MKKFCLAVGLAFWALGVANASEPREAHARTFASATEALVALDAQYAGFYSWLGQLYDPKEGGFRMAMSSTRKPQEYVCGLESTAQAIAILETSELLSRMPEQMRNQLVDFYRNRQESKDGFFYDTTPCTRSSSRLIGRSLDYSLAALQRLQTKPLYPTPKTDAILTVYPETESPEAWRRWVRQLDWRDPWAAGDRMNARISVLKQLPVAQRSPLLESLWAEVDATQSPETGLWGSDPRKRDYVYVSGAFKIAMIYQSFGRKVPRPDLIYQSILRCLRNEIADKYTFVRNPLSLLHVIRPQMTAPIPENEAAELIALTVLKNSKFLQTDGGFSRLWGAGYRGDSPCFWSDGLAEGDLNSGTQALNEVRKVCYELANQTMRPLDGTDEFYQTISLNPK